MAAGRVARSSHQPIAPLPYAGLQLRIVAFLLDAMVMISAFMLFVAAGGLQTLLRSDFGNVDPPDSAFYVWAGFVLAFIPFAALYFAGLWSWRGQTVGMMAVRIAVTDSAGNHLSFWKSLLRTLVWPLSVIPLGMGLLPILFDRHSRALHDMLAGTVVVELP